MSDEQRKPPGDPVADLVPTADAYPAVDAPLAVELVLPDGTRVALVGHSASASRSGVLTVAVAAAPANPPALLAALTPFGTARASARKAGSSPGGLPAAGPDQQRPMSDSGIPSRKPLDPADARLRRKSSVRRGGAAARDPGQDEASPRRRRSSVSEPPAPRANRPTEPLLPPRATPSRAPRRKPTPEAPVSPPPKPETAPDVAAEGVRSSAGPRRLPPRRQSSAPPTDAPAAPGHGLPASKPRSRSKTVKVVAPPADPGFPLEVPCPPPSAIEQTTSYPVGIDFGSSHCRIGVFRAGLELISDATDRFHIPASIPATAAFGARASSAPVESTGLPIDSLRWLLGLGDEAPAALAASGGPPAELSPDGTVTLELGDRRLSVSELCVSLLRSLRAQTMGHLRAEVGQAVLTVPASWGPGQRQTLATAARAAGLTNVALIADPVAALIGHGFRGHRGLIAVYNLGGSCEFSLLESVGTSFRVMCSGADPWLGGRELDAAIARTLYDSFSPLMSSSSIDEAYPWPALVRAAEQAKRALTNAESVDVRLPLGDSAADAQDDLRVTVTRAQLEHAAKPLLGRSLVLVQNVLEQAGVSIDAVDEVVMTGGCALIPLVRQGVARHFDRSPRIGDADLAVVRGAALYAGELGATSAAHRRAPAAKPTAPRTLRVQVEGGETHTICQRDSAIPITQRYALQTTRDGQTDLTFVVRADAPRGDNTRLLARLRYNGLPAAPAGSLSLTATFALESADELHITAAIGTQLFRTSVDLSALADD